MIEKKILKLGITVHLMKNLQLREVEVFLTNVLVGQEVQKVEITSFEEVKVDSQSTLAMSKVDSQSNGLLIYNYPKETTTLSTLDNVQIEQNSSNICDMKFDNHFEIFWASYPRKEHKGRAYVIWVRERLDRIALEIIADVNDRSARHDRWENKAYIPLPTTYLNNQVWLDEIVDRRKLIGDKNERTQASNAIHKLNKTESAILKGLDDYERAERQRRGL